MGWNTAALLVRDRSADQALTLLGNTDRFRPTDELVTADVASSHQLGQQQLAVAEDRAWCWLWDPHQQYVPYTYDLTGVDDASAVLAGTVAFAALFSSVSTIYGFWLYQDGKLVRRAIFENGELVDGVGKPLPCESGLGPEHWFSEEALWTVTTAVTGLSFRSDQQFRVYAELAD
jgi:hypothetical protein